MNHKFLHFTQSSIICGLLFSGLFFPMSIKASPNDPAIVLLADSSPVNPLNPAITVDPVEAPPESTDTVGPSRQNKELETVHPAPRKKTASVKKKTKVKKETTKKQSALKISNLTPYSIQPKAVLPPDPSSGGNNDDFTQTNTGQLLANLSGCILYGIKK
ncbi:exported hypothetical protein [Carnobacterium divergens]|nr:exported hypothetical protein [Carnobacterium divergens]